jgi:hypothetical protein
MPENVKPVAEPIAEKFTFVVVTAEASTSGALALVLPETTEFTTVIVPAVVDVRARPPPPVFKALPLALFPKIVELRARMPPEPVVTTAAPPLVPAVLPVTVEFSSSSVPVKLGRTTPPPLAAEVFAEIVLRRTTRVVAVKPTGGAADTVPKK